MSVANTKRTILNPTVPFTEIIPNGLHTGEMIIIQGCVQNNADRFQFDLTCGCSTKPRADVAFHFNPRFSSSPRIVCNFLHHENWGKEENVDLMPFKQGASFETIIMVLCDVFKAIFSNSSDLSIPYKGSLLRGVIPGQQITIKGHISLFPHSFTVNLRCGQSNNIALHIYSHIKSGKLIRNSLLSQSWGPEERELPYFPFSAGNYFEIIILCQLHQFKIAVNGSHLLDYNHRVQDLSSIDQLEILGDMELQHVQLW
ncbi:galectin-8 isoform X2 [Danio rerio]|uniref:Galectin-8 isoform X2 n=1 Tax=Danio rerio TaxID=7955 RepID=A0AC58HP74_DANRE